MKAKFSVGDTVRVLEPVDKSEYPTFTPGMKESIGHCYVIEEVSFNSNTYIYSFNIEGRRWYNYRESWLELVNSKGLNEIPVNKLLLLV